MHELAAVATLPPVRWTLLGLAVVTLAACAHTPDRDAPDPEPTGPEVEAIEIFGAKVLSPDELRAGLATRATGGWPWSDTRRLDPLALETDLGRIVTAYAWVGHFDAKVLKSLVIPVGPDRVRIELHVEEGPPSRVATVELHGLEPLPAELRDELRRLAGEAVQPGAVFQTQPFEAVRPVLVRRLREAGHASAEVRSQADAFPDRREVGVRFDVEPGPAVRYGELTVVGLAAQPVSPVKGIVRRVLPAGAPFDPRAIDEARDRLMATGAFAAVRITPGPPRDDVVDLEVRVDEAPVHAVSLGGGVAVDRNLQEVRLTPQYANTNLFGGLRRFAWTSSLALRFLPSFLSPVRTGFAGESTLEVTQAEVLARTDAAAQVGYQRVFRQAYEANALRLRLALPTFPTSRTRVIPAVAYRRFFGFTSRATGALPPNLRTDCPAPCALPGLELTLTQDGRDDPIAPRSGFLALVDLRYVAPVLQGRFHNLSVAPELRGFVPIAPFLVLAGRMQLGALVTLGAGRESPIVERFFGGGEGGHRGFAADQLSPFVQDPEGLFVPIGGNGLWLVTAEGRFRFGESWGVALFADWGDVTADPLFIDPRSAQLAVGLGLRYYSIAGPIRVDAAYRIAGPERVALDTGVSPDAGGLDYLALTFSLGEAF